MRCAVLQYENYHYECFGIAVQHIIDNAPDCSGIDVYFHHQSDPWAHQWLVMVSRVFKHVSMKRVTDYKSEPYDIFFLLSSQEKNKLDPIECVEPPKRLVCITHHLYFPQKEFTNLTIVPYIPGTLATFPNYGDILKTWLPNDFFQMLDR